MNDQWPTEAQVEAAADILKAMIPDKRRTYPDIARAALLAARPDAGRAKS